VIALAIEVVFCSSCTFSLRGAVLSFFFFLFLVVVVLPLPPLLGYSLMVHDMGKMDHRHKRSGVHTSHSTSTTAEIRQVQNVAFADATAKANVKPWTKAMFKVPYTYKREIDSYSSTHDNHSSTFAFSSQPSTHASTATTAPSWAQ